MKKDKRILIPRDEFEEEAGEGLGQLSREEAEADLRELKARMERRVARPRAIWLPAAAAVVILVVASGILVTLLRQRSAVGPELAQKEMTNAGAGIDDNASIAMAKGMVTDTALIAMAQPIEKKGHGNTAPLIAGIAVSEVSEVAADEVFAVVEEVADVAKVAEEPVVAMQVVGAEKVRVAEAEKAEAVLAEQVVVQAVPQPGAAAPKTKAVAEAKTDIKTDAQAADKAAAMEGQAIIMEPAAPVGGWSKYVEWVARNIRYPEGVQPIIKQEVQVSFLVQPDSTLSDLKVVSSPGEPFAREAFRLLREGPKWVPAGGDDRVKSEKVVVTFVFK